MFTCDDICMECKEHLVFKERKYICINKHCPAFWGLAQPLKCHIQSKNIVEDFLYNTPQGKSGFPNSNIMIGVDFEIGGRYEDWGFGIYEVSYNADKDAYDKKLISSGGTLVKAIDKAIEILKKS